MITLLTSQIPKKYSFYLRPEQRFSDVVNEQYERWSKSTVSFEKPSLELHCQIFGGYITGNVGFDHIQHIPLDPVFAAQGITRLGEITALKIKNRSAYVAHLALLESYRNVIVSKSPPHVPLSNRSFKKKYFFSGERYGPHIKLARNVGEYTSPFILDRFWKFESLVLVSRDVGSENWVIQEEVPLTKLLSYVKNDNNGV